MQIRNFHIQSHPVGEPKGRKLAAASAPSGNAPVTEGAEKGLNQVIDNADELQAQLKSMPEVREEVVAEAKARLASGEYNLKSAAADTAAAILQQS